MKKTKYQDVNSIESEKVGIQGAEGLGVRPLIGKQDGALNFSMSVLELKPGGHTPEHSHEREEQLFVMLGNGEVKTGDGSHALEAGEAVFFPSGETHQVLNPGAEPLLVLVVTN
ncbi:MAG: cupin domain-containing protein [Deltaproteobacteria bacterium]|nr:cupin domain-containing protein [Deltaproteobacteria bacterium]